MTGEKKPADQAGLGCPANTAGLYAVALQTVSTTFGDTTFQQAIRATFGDAVALQTVGTAFGDTTFQQTIRATFGNTVALQTVSTAFGNTTFHQTIRAAFSDNRVGKCVGCEYRESEAKQDLAFHESVLRVF